MKQSDSPPFVGEVRARLHRKGGLVAFRVSGDVRLTTEVYGHRRHEVFPGPADVTAVHECFAGGVQLGDESIPDVAVVAEVWPGLHRKGGLVALRIAGDVGVAGGIDIHRGGKVVLRAADVATEHQGRAGRVDLHHEGVRAAVVRQVWPGQHGKPDRLGTVGLPDRVQIAGTIDGHGSSMVMVAAAYVATVDQDCRIENEWARSVVGPQPKPERSRLILLKRVRHFDWLLLAMYPLVGNRSGILEAAHRSFDSQSTGFGHGDGRRPAVAETNLAGIGTRLNHELVLELVHGAGVDEVDPRIQVPVDEFLEGRAACLPVLARPQEVTDHTGLFLFATRHDTGVCADEVELHDPATLLVPKLESHAVVGEEERLVRAPDVVANRVGVDAAVFDEQDRQLAERGPDDRRRRAGGFLTAHNPARQYDEHHPQRGGG